MKHDMRATRDEKFARVMRAKCCVLITFCLLADYNWDLSDAE